LKAAILFVFILFFSFMPVSYAASDNSGAGIMPGSFLYSFDLFFERVDLFFTFNQQKKARIMASIARERQLELEALDNDVKDRYSSALARQRDLYTEMASNLIDDSSVDDNDHDDSSVVDDGSDDSFADDTNPDDSSFIDDDSDNSSAVSDELPTDIEDDTDPVTNTSLQAEPEDSNMPGSKLSVFQETACLAADEGNTCNTKLSELGLVTKERCCASLGVCCS